MTLSLSLICKIFSLSLSTTFYSLRDHDLQGSTEAAGENNYADPGIDSDLPIYSIQPLCNANSTWPLSLGKTQTGIFQPVSCTCVRNVIY